MDDKISFHDQVSVAEGIGTVQFIGKLPDIDDYFFGIELTTPTGGSNGSFDGKECFDCAAGHGVFVRRSEILEMLSLGDTGISVGDAVSNEVYDCHGFVQYIGKIPPLPGVWFGIELVEPVGQHDGTFMGNRYFTCEENHGVCLSQDQINFLSTVPPRFTIGASNNADEEPEPEPEQQPEADPEPEPEPVAPAELEPEPAVDPEPATEPEPEQQPEESKEPEPIISPDLTPVNSGMGDEKAVDDQDKICFGDVVNVKKGRGTIKYIGPVDGKQGTFFGIELLKPAGKSNGSVNGRSYFKARPNHGIFTKRQRILTIVERIPEDFALRISVGDLVHVLSKDAHGVVKFIGVTPFGKPPRDQPYYGIEMEEPVGKNDGTVKGIRYFETTENRGVFVRKDQLQLVQDDDSIGSF